MLPIRTILHPTDFSGRSDYAFQAAHSLARDHGSRLVVVYVRAPAVVAYGELGPVVPDPIQTPQEVKERLDAQHVIDPWVEIEYRIAEGDPATEIVRMAQAVGANLIAVSYTHLTLPTKRIV